MNMKHCTKIAERCNANTRIYYIAQEVNFYTRTHTSKYSAYIYITLRFQTMYLVSAHHMPKFTEAFIWLQTQGKYRKLECVYLLLCILYDRMLHP